MKNMVKVLFRYLWKNKLNLISLLVFTTLSATAFSSLMLLSTNLTRSYNYLVDNGNLSDGIIHELYANSVKVDDPTTPEDERQLTGAKAVEYNKKEFLNELGKKIGKENFRPFNAVDYTGTNSGFSYKIIESETDYTINKLVMYDGHNTLPMQFDFGKIIKQADWASDQPTAIEARKLLVRILARAKWTDDSYEKAFNAAVGKPEDPKKMKGKVKNVLQKGLDKTLPSYIGFRNKGYRLSFSDTGVVPPYAFNFDNFSSYSLVAPNYIYEQQDKEMLPTSYFEEYMSKFLSQNSKATQVEFDEWLKAVPTKYKIKIDNMELLLIGKGLSPDFMYPVFDLAHATPNIKKEIIAYGNSGAYELVRDANRSAPIEEYLVFKTPNYNQNLINELNELAKKYMSWPDNVPAVYAMNDVGCLLSPNGIRTSFLPNLVDLQVGLSNAISFFVAILTSIIFIFTIKKFIYDNKSSLAVLRANGFKKRWIIWLMPILGVIPSVVGGILSYIIAASTQKAMLSLYSTYWIIPTTIQIFNPLLFFGIILVPFFIMGVLAVLFSWLALRKNTKELMSESSRFVATPLSKVMTKGLKKFPIMTRFKTSVAFSSLPKLFAITTLFALVSTTFSFSMAYTGKFDQIKAATYDTKKYQFALDVITPTVQGGGYIAQSFYDAGKPLVDQQNRILNFNGSINDSQLDSVRGQKASKIPYLNNDFTVNPEFTKTIFSNKTTEVGDFSLSHLPSLSDAEWQKYQFNYLKYRMETAPFVDIEIGGANPWNIARALMPANAISQSNIMYMNLWSKLIKDTNIYFDEQSSSQYEKDIVGKLKNKPLNSILKEYKYVEGPKLEQDVANVPDDSKVYLDKDTGDLLKGWYFINRKKFVPALPFHIDDTYTALMTRIMNLEQYRDDFYKVMYSTVAIEKGDETYTKVKANLEVPNGPEEKIEIMGIKPDTKYVDLINRKNKKINDKLKLNKNGSNNIEEQLTKQNKIHDIYSDEALLKQSNNYNLIINESAAYQYKLKIGSEVTIDPTEEATRFNPRTYCTTPNNVVDLSSYNKKKFTFKVVDIIKTYQNPEFYINQRIANYVNAMHLTPIIEKSFYNFYNYDKVLGKDDVNKIDVYQMDPWNGIFSNQAENKNVSVNTVLYSASSLAPPSDTIGLNPQTRTLVNEAIKANVENLKRPADAGVFLAKIDIARALGYVDPVTLNVTPASLSVFDQEFGADPDAADKIITNLMAQYSDSPFLSAVNNAVYVQMYVEIFDNVTKFINSISTLLFVIIFIISILSITILATDFISSSLAICAILKALGVTDRQNAFSFLSMFFPASIIALAVSIPLSMLLFNWFTGLIYGFSTIFVPMFYNWWFVFVDAILVMATIGITIAISIYKLKKQQLTKAISGF